MNREKYEKLIEYMLSCVPDTAHDSEHIMRVLYVALDIAKYETDVDYDVLIAACLLHDVGRPEQFSNPSVCHAAVGAVKAHAFLVENGYGECFADRVSACIETHRFRSDNQPESTEARILFDADKVDVTGLLGIARTLVYKGKTSSPLYSLNSDGTVSDGENSSIPSFFNEYNIKLKKLYSRFYTKRGAEIAIQRQKEAAHFHNELFNEISFAYKAGESSLGEYISVE